MSIPMIECNGIGEPVYIERKQEDSIGRKFFEAYNLQDLVVNIGDNVRIKLDADAQTAEDFAFAQVLAIYEDADDEELFIEVRWYKVKNDLTPAHRKKVAVLENELFESDCLDDVPAGAVCERIEITDQPLLAASFSSASSSSSSCSSVFVVRYMEVSESNALHSVALHSSLQRGLGLSHYSEAYGRVADAAGHAEEVSSLLDNDEYSSAIKRLHISVIPQQLPCRTAERFKIESFMRDGVAARGCGKAMYISGMPGTGKTATVMSCVNTLREEAVSMGGRSGGTGAGEFTFIEINCLRLTSPADAYTVLWRAISGLHCSSKTALRKLGDFFTEQQHVVVNTTASTHSSSSSGSGVDQKAQQQQQQQQQQQRRVFVILVDELDYLMTKDSSVLYNFLNWPLLYGYGLVIIGIANAMDLPEQLSTR